jgi:large subunit ribosomal protein L44
LKEARIKSFNKALKAWYLYKPLDAKLPSDSDFTGMYVDQGEKFY